MKKYSFFSLLLLISQFACAQYSAKAFQMVENIYPTIVHVGIESNQDTIITFNTSTPISQLYISGTSILGEENNSHIRLTLQDDYNTEYLIYELYPVLADSNNMAIDRTAIETKCLNHVVPQSIKIEVSNAIFQLDTLYYVEDQQPFLDRSPEFEILHKEQNRYIVERLNMNLEARNIPWRAGITEISRKTFEEKKDMFGGTVPNLGGFEYYIGGIFIMPNSSQSSKQVSINTRSTYVNEWDWRDRHGRNWMTSVKGQKNCGSCWAFSAIGTFESYINLYYNRLLDYNLSEQEILSCGNAGNCQGGSLKRALDYIDSVGVIPEECFEYTATNNSCDNKCDNPSDILSFEQYSNAYTTDEDSIKRLLFKSPICFGIYPWWHFIVLAGFIQIESGDYYFTSGNHSYTTPINSDNPLVGHPAWLIKNSWGPDWGDNGYGYVAMALSDAYSIYKISGNVSSQILNDSFIACEDLDGDGFYNWGIGPKPTHCPTWVPDTPDGDDSDYEKGPMDAYGHLVDLPSMIPDSTIYITQNTVWTTRKYVYHDVYVYSGKTLRITNNINFYRGVTLYLSPGSTLIVDGATLTDVDINFMGATGTSVQILHNGKIKCVDNQDFVVPLGVTLDINYGKIN